MASASITSPGAYPVMLAGHSGRLKYAEARDLPSYPSPGLRPGDAAASAAATRGWASTPVSPAFQNQNQSSTPRLSQDALLAAGWAQRQKHSSLPAPSSWGSTAANLAFKAGQTAPAVTAESPELSRQNSMRAAKGAMGGLRPRARSSPQAPVEEEEATDTTSVTHALSAATIAHRPSMRAPASPVSPVGDAGAIPFTTMNRMMFTSHPPVKPETDEKNRADVLHASALAMAKKMYDHQQRIIDNSARAHARSASLSAMDPTTGDDQQQQQQQPPMIYTSLQEAAYRQAQERLAKLQQEYDAQRSLQEYYNTTPTTPTTLQRGGKLGSTLKGKLTRRRSSSDGDLHLQQQQLEDRRRSEQIRTQMTLLSTRLGAVDEDKRARDRAALLAAAQRNVRARMAEMDEKNEKLQLQQTGGKVGGMDDWGRKALVAAQARFDAAGGYGNAGKVDIGGGKMIERSEVERIAAAKVQPLLDEINERAEKEQARVEEERLDAERRREEAEREKAREREVEEIHRQLKEQQKEDERARKAEIKHEEKLRKEEAKAIKAEQKQAAKEEKHKDKEVAVPPPPATTTTAEAEESTAPAAAQEREKKRLSGMSVRHVRALSIPFPKRQARTPRGKDKDAASPTEAPHADDSATSPTRKVRAWLLSRFPRPRAKSAAAEGAEERHDDAHDGSNRNSNGAGAGTERGFIGGVALARLQGKNPSASSVEGQPHPVIQQQEEAAQRSGQDLSMREVAMAGRQPLQPPLSTGDEPGESSASAAFIDPTTPPTTTAADYGTSTVPVTTTIATYSLAAAPRTPSPRIPTAPAPAGEARRPRPASQVSAASVPLSVSERSVSSLSSSGGLSSDGEGDGEGEHFVMARSGQSPEPAAGTLSPPQNLALAQPRVVGGAAMAGRVSPFRESRFSEILE